MTYEVESQNGGYLPVGKLTGKVETDKAKGFAVRTPTAIVTDLGTEFGVEVSQEGAVETQVIAGAVKIEFLGARNNGANEQIVHAQAARFALTARTTR